MRGGVFKYTALVLQEDLHLFQAFWVCTAKITLRLYLHKLSSFQLSFHGKSSAGLSSALDLVAWSICSKLQVDLAGFDFSVCF